MPKKLQTSILTLSLSFQAVEKWVPELFRGYHVALQHHLITQSTREARIELLAVILPEIRKEIDALAMSLRSSAVSDITNGIK